MTSCWGLWLRRLLFTSGYLKITSFIVTRIFPQTQEAWADIFSLSLVSSIERVVSEQSWAGGLVGARNFHARGCSIVPFITSGFGKWLIFRLSLSGYDSKPVLRSLRSEQVMLIWTISCYVVQVKPPVVTSWALSLLITINTAGSAVGLETNFCVRLIIRFW